MISLQEEVRLIALSTCLYRILLAAYPSGFRQEYGPQMAQVFRDLCLRTYSNSGSTGMLWLWTLTLLDLFSSVVEEHLQRKTFMSKEKFVRLSGWGFILGIVTFWLTFVFEKQQTGYFDLGGADGVYELGELISGPLAFLLLSMGMLGLYLRYAQTVGQPGRITLGIGVVTGITGAISFVGLMFFDGSPWWSILFFSMTLLFLSLAIFGLVTMRSNLLPRWQATPLFAGVWIPLVVMITAIAEGNSGNWVEGDLLFNVAFVLTAIGTMALGYLLQGDAPEDLAPTG